MEKEITKELVEELLHFDFSDQEVAYLQKAKIAQKATTSKYNLPLYKTIKVIVDQRTNTGWTSGGHTAVDVQVFAMGAGSDMFRGKIDNTDIAKKIFNFLGK